MKKKAEEVRNEILKMRVSADELKCIQQFRKKTTEKSLSNYARKILLKQPVTVLHRNQSADAFLSEMVKLKRELNALGNNYNQTVHKMHTIERIPEFRAWIQVNEQSRNAFLVKVDQIGTRLFQIHQQWSQE